MPLITVTFGTKSHSHNISNGDATRMLNMLGAARGIPATVDAVCPAIAKEFFQGLKSQTQQRELLGTAIADIPATES